LAEYTPKGYSDKPDSADGGRRQRGNQSRIAVPFEGQTQRLTVTSSPGSRPSAARTAFLIGSK
jgi:hypothetical protein